MDQGSPEYEKEYDPQRTEFSFITLTTMEFLFLIILLKRKMTSDPFLTFSFSSLFLFFALFFSFSRKEHSSELPREIYEKRKITKENKKAAWTGLCTVNMTRQSMRNS